MESLRNGRGSDRRLAAICPYFTMFPLEFPLNVLEDASTWKGAVLDPFCGRGTTNFAARIVGQRTAGIDSSRVAVAATDAKLVDPTPKEIIETARCILGDETDPCEIPQEEFWCLAYRPKVLRGICQIREELLSGQIRRRVAAALRGIMLGALHGPVGKTIRSYFSNQSPRTYGPKPGYAVRYWKKRKLRPPHIDVLSVIRRRANWYYGVRTGTVSSMALRGDSRKMETVARACGEVGEIGLVITSPPYYGLNTYVPDQWIRDWFLGGPSTVDYSSSGQISHGSLDAFVSDLRTVWTNVGRSCRDGARLVVRFGSIRDRLVPHPDQVIKRSFEGTAWRFSGSRPAGNASMGRRQADSFQRSGSRACEEWDVWAKWCP